MMSIKKPIRSAHDDPTIRPACCSTLSRNRDWIDIENDSARGDASAIVKEHAVATPDDGAISDLFNDPHGLNEGVTIYDIGT